MQIEREDKGSAQSQPSPASPSDCAENGPLRSGGESQATPRTAHTTCIETVGGDPATALRLSFQIKVF